MTVAYHNNQSYQQKMLKTRRLLSFYFLFSLFFNFSLLSQDTSPSDLLNGLNPRSIGPAGMGGRITTVEVAPNKQTIFVGTASGGVWRSLDEGLTWKPIFDKQGTSSIGAIAIDANDPNTIWVGTGEGNPRNSQNTGNGIYLSEDGGNSWKHMGLPHSKSIHRIIIDPIDPNTLYVGVQGVAWGASSERGVFKTVNKGETWEKILYVDEFTGVADMVMDPSNPSKIIAAVWEFRRWPWFFKSGGNSSGLYITYDAGKTWEQKTSFHGLPQGEWGRIGLALAPSNPEVIYALIEAKETALYRSNNGGENWFLVTKQNVGNRPFYYADIYVDPKNPERLYNLWSIVTVSNDGGRTFRPFLSGRNAHGDHHAFWINPDDPNFIIDGNDGGLVITKNKGKTWRYVRNLPISQFYHVNIDDQMPYHVYGGIQDNGAWAGPAFVWKEGGIRNEDWYNIGSGDGFDAIPAQNGRYGFSLWQGGNLVRYDTKTGLKQQIRPVPTNEKELRFNWNAAFAKDPINENTIYLGSQFVHKSTDNGNSWEIISPDLTTNDSTKQNQQESGGLTIDDTRAENYTTLTALAVNQKDNNIIWSGSDDGLIHFTKDGGNNWKKVTPSEKIAPKNSWVNQIVLSPNNPAEAFVVMDNHRSNDYQTYILHTTNFGKTWKNIADKSLMQGYSMCIWQDPKADALLFAGLETGLFVSFDKGNSWIKWPSEKFPTVPVSDMVQHAETNDLVLATFGRSFYVIDDISPLRDWVLHQNKIVQKGLHLYDVPNAFQAVYATPNGSEIYSAEIFEGDNKPKGVPITFFAEPELEEPMASVKIKNNQGETIRNFTVIVEKGLNRIYWELCRKNVHLPGKYRGYFNAETPGVPVSPGEYQLEVAYAGKKEYASIKVLPDPRLEQTFDYDKFEAFYHRWKLALYTTSAALDRLEEAKHSISNVEMRLIGNNDAESQALMALTKKIENRLEQYIYRVKLPPIQGVIRESGVINDQLADAIRYFNSPYVEIHKNHELVIENLEKSVKDLVFDVNLFFDEEWKLYKKEVASASITFLNDYQPLIMGASVDEDDE